MKRDKQKNRVYKWERKFVIPFDNSVVRVENAQPIVDYVWRELGLQFPPMVRPMKVDGNCGRAHRTVVSLGKVVSTWLILHELSHSLSCLHTGETNQHGALFMGLYCQLLHKFLGMDFEKLVESATTFRLHVNPLAKPVFLP